MKTKTVKLTFSGGFHNCGPINIRVNNQTADDIKEGFYPLSECLTSYQLKRLNRHFCGVDGCFCGGVMRATIEF